MRSQTHRLVVQVLLALVIAGLAYWLYRSITEPWKVVERREETTRLTRARMDLLRTALTHYERTHRRFPLTADSLLAFVRQDAGLRARIDSVFGPAFPLDSLLHSPRTGRPFTYAVNDTAPVKMYRLQDPDTPDRIGTLDPDPTQRHAATWE
jgi:hypothetical protein